MKFQSIVSLLVTVSVLLSGCGGKGQLLATDAAGKGETVIATEESLVSTEPAAAVDLMEMAITESSYRISGLSGLSNHTYGAGCYTDYMLLHSSPLKCAAYAWDMRDLAANVGSEADGLSGFCETVTASKGLRYNIAAEYQVFTDLEEALAALFAAAGNTAELKTAQEALDSVPEYVKEPLAKWVSAAAYAYSVIMAEAENVSLDAVSSLLAFSCCPPASDDIGLLREMKDLKDSVSLQNILRGGAAVLEASEEISRLIPAGAALTSDGSSLTIPTPLGVIILGSPKADTYDSPGALLILESGGNDIYNGRVASGCVLDTPVSAVIDISGNDTYDAGSSDSVTQGAGVFGAGILIDAAGQDSYSAECLAQGACIMGMGILLDADGDDGYSLSLTGQGAGFFGLAVLADRAGNDNYTAKGYAQASAGPQCMAYLLDISGDDKYYVNPYVEQGFEVLDYGQYPGVSGNWSQGCGWGQRVIDLSGGVGGLVDLSGNDNYDGGIWVQGTGYWSGIGFLFDETGDDTYHSCYYSQASAAHFGAAILVDAGGNDIHNVNAEGIFCGDGASLAFVWDRGVAMFVDDGGDDQYFADRTSCGVAMSAYDGKGYQSQDMTYAIFLDTAGEDGYHIGETECVGWGRGGFFIDAAGTDEYEVILRSDNRIATGSFYQGGVFLDYAVTAQTPGSPIIGFWESAKSGTGSAAG